MCNASNRKAEFQSKRKKKKELITCLKIIFLCIEMSVVCRLAKCILFPSPKVLIQRMNRPVRLLILTPELLTGKTCSIRSAWECPAQSKFACKFGIKLGEEYFFFLPGARGTEFWQCHKISFGLFSFQNVSVRSCS